MSAARIRIEIAYAAPQRTLLKAFHLAPESRVADALRLAALDPDFLGVNLMDSPLGIFGRPASPDQKLEEGDRLEIYRPLAADPKAARRARARQAHKKP